MRKAPLWLFIIVLALTGVVLWQRHETDQATTTKPGSTIDQLLQNNTTGASDTGTATNITIDNSTSASQYQGGGTYEEFSQQTVNNAIGNQQRVILIFERAGDPTSLALRDDISARKARIPANTTLFFINTDNDSVATSRFGVSSPNTIVYLGTGGEEIRRKGNGIVSLDQIVKGIDGLK